MALYLSEEEAIKLISRIQKSGIKYFYDLKKHKISVLDGAGEVAIHFRLPITIPPIVEIKNLDFPPVNYIILLIQSGSSAVGYCEGENLIDHKVFKSYMVRKKQGKSQIKYLKTKGKSRAGSRVRLGNAMNFFEDINERLQEYFKSTDINRIAISCSKTLIPFLFNSKTPCPFDKNDERIYKIPKHIHTPGYEVLQETHWYLKKGELVYAQEHKSFAHSFL